MHNGMAGGMYKLLHYTFRKPEYSVYNFHYSEYFINFYCEGY